MLAGADLGGDRFGDSHWAFALSMWLSNQRVVAWPRFGAVATVAPPRSILIVHYAMLHTVTNSTHSDTITCCPVVRQRLRLGHDR